MDKRLLLCMILLVHAASPWRLLAADATTAQQAAGSASAGISTLPPTGKGNDMVKPYQPGVAVPDRNTTIRVDRDETRNMRLPLSRETVPSSYRYGTPGYSPDGRGGRGYDFGYPGYRNQGGGGYPHRRPSPGRGMR